MSKAAKPNMKPRLKPRGKPQMTRIKTVWVTEQTAPFTEDYKVGNQIGEPGQFGKAYGCANKKTRETYAVKVISKARFYRLDSDPKRRQALLASMQGEINIMRRLKHKNIVHMASVYENKQELFIVMEECKGGELFDRIRARGKYSEPDAARVLRMVLDALNYMHEYHRVVHCDLKPDNILFKDMTEDSDIKIIDFGMSKVLPRLRSLRELCGTPYYTAPEILDGEFAHEADMWSVGVIMFVMLFGFPPFYVDPSKFYGRAEAEAIYALIKRGFTPVVKKGYGPWFPQKIAASDEARDLIGKLLETDRAKRMNAKEALTHPWIKKGGVTEFYNTHKKALKAKGTIVEEKSEEVVDSVLFHQFAKFNNNCNFKLAIIQLFQHQFEEMRPAHFSHLKEVFQKLDKDGNGKISFEEFEEGMLQMKDTRLSKERLREMFSELDVNSVGEIGFQELLNAAVHDYLVASDERLYQAFRELDENDDGNITTDQLKTKLKEINPYNHYNDLLKVIDDADLDKDGQINYEEFLRALHPNFNEQPVWFWEDEDTDK